TCAQIKTDIVEKDEKEKGLRAILNFGHTIGHSLEVTTGYKLKHGSAVSIGMVAAIKISVKKKLLEENDEIRILNLIHKYNLPTHIREVDAGKIYHAMKHDKKIINNK
ncbi:MAG: 3-dehydroquinate synthase, partial [Rhodocyclaceae bacterium]|nr:3-dehydroquinate synthase [Rhodocyclaceae bacterium]